MIAPATSSPIAGASLKQWPLPPVARNSPSYPSTGPSSGCQSGVTSYRPTRPPTARMPRELAAAGSRRGSRTSASNACVDRLVEGVRVDLLVLLREAAPDEDVPVAVLGRRAHVDAVGLRRDRAQRDRGSAPVVVDDVLLARDLERQLEADPVRERDRPRAGGEHDAVALDQLAADAHAAHARRSTSRSPSTGVSSSAVAPARRDASM